MIEFATCALSPLLGTMCVQALIPLFPVFLHTSEHHDITEMSLILVCFYIFDWGSDMIVLAGTVYIRYIHKIQCFACTIGWLTIACLPESRTSVVVAASLIGFSHCDTAMLTLVMNLPESE